MTVIMTTVSITLSTCASKVYSKVEYTSIYIAHRRQYKPLMLRLQLSDSYCTPVLQYCLDAVTFSKSQVIQLKCLLEYGISQNIWLS